MPIVEFLACVIPNRAVVPDSSYNPDDDQKLEIVTALRVGVVVCIVQGIVVGRTEKSHVEHFPR